MSALCGYWCFNGRRDAHEQCARMLAAQEMYGPHAGAQWSNAGVAMGRRLMRLLPEDTFDQQPLIGAGRRFALIADLRLDNRDELADELGIARTAAAQLSDAGILLVAVDTIVTDVTVLTC